MYILSELITETDTETKNRYTIFDYEKHMAK